MYPVSCYSPQMRDSKICASCHQEGHSRSTSHKCPNHKDRPGREKPPLPDDEDDKTGFWTEEQGCIKVGLMSILRNEQLYRIIQTVVSEVTRSSFEVSRLLQYHVQRVLEASLPLPNILNETWVRQCYAIFQGKPVGDQELQTSFGFYMQRRTLLEPLPSLSATPPEVITLAVKSYVTTIATHIDRLHRIVVKRWMATIFRKRGLPRKAARRMAAFMMDLCFETEVTDEDVNDEFLRSIIRIVSAFETRMEYQAPLHPRHKPLVDESRGKALRLDSDIRH